MRLTDEQLTELAISRFVDGHGARSAWLSAYDFARYASMTEQEIKDDLPKVQEF